jgi:hypothetical protein
MSMTWTRSAPSRPGFYYWNGLHLSSEQVAVVQVSGFKNQSRELEATELLVSGWKNAPPDGPVSTWGGFWAGPLPQPYAGSSK